MDQDPFFFNVGPDGSVEAAAAVTLSFRGPSPWDLRWRFDGMTVPAFWPTLFAGTDLTDSISRTSWDVASGRLADRAASWKAKSSAHLFRGYLVFADWVGTRGRGEVVLDASAHEPWRRIAFRDAARRLIDFLDDRESDPGPLLSGWKESVA